MGLTAAFGRRLMKHLLILILLLSCRISEPIIFLHMARACTGPRKARASGSEEQLCSRQKVRRRFQRLRSSHCAGVEGVCFGGGWLAWLSESLPVFSSFVFTAVKIKSDHLESHMCDPQTSNTGVHSLFLD